MSAKKVQKKGWPVKASAPPKLSNTHWGLSTVVGLVLLVMAVLQLISFADFRDALDTSGLPAPTVWAVCVIVAELWGSVGFFRIPLSFLFRQVSYTMAVLAAGFWFIYNIQLVAGANQFSPVDNSAFFGRFLQQTPGWWTVLEATVLLFAVVYKVGLLRDNQPTTRRAR
jgi:hypothetical protein